MSATAIERLNAALSGRYRIESELGEGGMATVYLADDLKHERKVALKVLKPELAAVVGAERFLAEIKTTANLQHPHILPLFDSGEADGFLFYVMPYVEGESLRERLDREHQLPVDDAVGIASNVAEALDYAHSQGVIHRDIKPANILLQAGKPVISDFGIALAVSAGGGGRLTETGLSLGTPHYMSPEQATGDQSVGPATDIYGLGCVLYEMLVGEPPFTGSTPQAVLGKIITEPPPQVTKARGSVSANVEAAIAKALEKVPADRFLAAVGVRDALADAGFRHRDALKGGSSGSSGTGLRVIIGGLMLVALVQAWALYSGPSAGSADTRFLTVVVEPPIGLNGNGESVLLSPEGRSIAYRAADGRWWVRRLSGQAAEPLDYGSGQHLAFSPQGDGAAIRSGSRAGRIRVGTLTGGDPRSLADGSVGGFAGIDWGKDGWIYFTDTDRRLSRVLASGGSPQPLTSLGIERDEVSHVDPHRIWDGEGVVFVIRLGRLDNLDGSELAVLDLKTQEYRWLGVVGLSPKVTSSGHLVFARPDGTLMAGVFDTDRLEFTTDPVEVLSGINVRGGNNAVADFEISRGGDLLYLPDAPFGSSRAVWTTSDGQEEFAGEEREGLWFGFDLSPDGSRVVASIHPHRGPRNIYRGEFPGGAMTRLTYGEDYDAMPVFLNDSIVLFSSPRAGNWDLYRRQWNRSGTSELMLDRPGEIRSKSASEEAGVVVFQESTSANTDLFSYWLDGDSVTPLVTTPFTEGSPAIAPGAEWVAYTSDQSGQTEVWVTPLPGSGATQVSDGGGTTPKWSRTGTELFYRDAEGFITAVPVELGSTFNFREGRRLFSMDGSTRLEVAPDGRFLIIRGDGAHLVDQVVLVTNWLAQLTRLVPN